MVILARFTNIPETETSFLSLELNGNEVIYFDLKNTKYDLDSLNPEAIKFQFQLVSDDKLHFVLIEVVDSNPEIVGSSLPLEDLKLAISKKMIEDIKILSRLMLLYAYASGLSARNSLSSNGLIPPA